MLDKKPMNSLKNGRVTFFQEFLKHPLQVGSIIPSSHFLEKRILQVAGIASANTIVELGPGTGGTTRAILATMPAYAKLLSIEINPHFHQMLSDIDDERFILHLGNACELQDIISMYGLEPPNVVISGIPFSTMSERMAFQVIEAISTVLAPHGRFVAYQVSNRIVSICEPYLGREKSMVELFNIPPMRIYQWEKNTHNQSNPV